MADGPHSLPHSEPPQEPPEQGQPSPLPAPLLPADESAAGQTPPTPSAKEPNSGQSKLLFRCLVGAFLCILLFHRPLLHGALTILLQRAAQKDGLTLNVQLSGNVFRQISLDNLSLTPSKPTADNPQPTEHSRGHAVRFISVKHAQLRYSLPRLLWSGPGECIDSYSIHGASFLLRAPQASSVQTSATPKPPATSNRSFAAIIEDILGQPALYADAVHIEQLDLEIEGAAFLKAIRGLELSAFPSRPGFLKIASLELENGAHLENLAGKTTYAGRNLEIRELKLTPEVSVESFTFDASERSLGKSRAQIQLRSKSGSLLTKIFAEKGAISKNPEFHWSFSASHFSASDLGGLFGWKPPVSQIEWAECQLQGNPHAPSSWKGQADIRCTTPLLFSGLASGSPAADPLDTPSLNPLVSELHASFESGVFRIDSLNAFSGTTSATASGSLRLPPSASAIEQTRGTIGFHLTCEDIAEWNIVPKGPASNPLSGNAILSGTLSFAEGLATCRLQGTATTQGPVQLTEAVVSLNAGTPLKSDSSLFDPSQITGNITLSAQNPGLQTHNWSLAFGELQGVASLQNGRLSVGPVVLTKNSNIIRASGDIPILKSGQGAPPTKHLEIHANCPALEKTGLTIFGHKVAGALTASTTGELQNGQWTGPLNVSSKSLSWGGFDLGELGLQSAFADNHLAIKELFLGWNKEEWIRLSGDTDLAAPRSYKIKSEAHLSRLERFAPLLQQSHLDSSIGGSLDALWNGQGTLQPLSGSGNWQVSVKNGRWNSLLLNETVCNGTYAPGQFNAHPVRIVTPHTKLNTKVQWSEDTLRIQEIALEQWGYPTLSGFLLLPLTWGKDGAKWSETSRISGQLNANGLDLVSLFTAAGIPAPLAGSVKFTLLLSGTPTAPSAGFNLSARELRSPSNPALGTAEFDLNGRYASGNLESEATLRSALQSPVSLQFKAPIPFSDLLLGKITPKQTPIQAHLQTARANLKLLPNLWPALKKVEGSLSLDMHVGGTLQNPTWKGAASLDVPVTHFVSYRFPAITDLRANVEFDEKDIRLRSLNADLGGGTLHIDGNAHLGNDRNTTLDFKASANQILIVRSRDLLLRLDGDVRIHGPWQQATISGTGFATKSRATRDIEILSVATLKKATTPLPQSGIGKPWFTFQRAPFSAWKFDIGFHTRPDDPFLLRGNRLHGSAQADLVLKGTGAAPTLEGNYKTNDLVAYLPFARIEISRGHCWYFPDQPFHPQLDFSAETEVRNHRIRLYVTGTPEVPRVTLNSDPPLNETDLLTLLTTGVLPGDTSENGQALAGRAAAVLFQELSGKVLNSSSGRERLAALRRFTLDVGALNSRTGHQETKLTYRMNDNFFMIGELGANGDFGGQIKYLIRFR